MTAARALRRNWSMPASVCLHGVIAAVFLVKFTNAAPPLPATPDVQLAVEVLVMPPPPPPPPMPEVAEEPPPVLQSVAEDAPVEPPPPPPLRKRPEIRPKPVKLPPQPVEAPPAETFAEASPAPVVSPPRAEQVAVVGPVGRAGPPAQYQDRLFAHIQRNHKRAPKDVLRYGQRVTAVVAITLGRDGKIVRYDIAGSSGNPRIDREIGPLMARCDPMPAFPAEMAGESFTFKMPIEFVGGR
ncbi:MAG TPA: TonB family protein [Alphaproteobacteria bacterium]|nr:TonB family protein [Alphaproteobacteria bacterium]